MQPTWKLHPTHGAGPVTSSFSIRALHKQEEKSATQKNTAWIQTLLQLPSKDISWKAGELQKIKSIGQFPDEEIFFESLLHFGVELKREREWQKASLLLGALRQDPQVPAEIQRRAEKEFNAVEGKGSFGLRFEVFAGKLINQSTDVRMVAPMIGASVLGHLAGASVLARLTGSGQAWYSRRLGAQITSELAAYAVEFPSFALFNRAMSPRSEGTLRDDLWRTAITLGMLRITRQVGQSVFRQLHRFNEFGAPSQLLPMVHFNQAAIPQLSMFAGLAVSHLLETEMKPDSPADPGTFLSDILSSMLSLGIGAHLGRRVLGAGFAQFESELALRAKFSREQGGQKKFHSLSPSHVPEKAAWAFAPIQMAGIGGSGGKGGEGPPSSPRPTEPAWTRAQEKLALQEEVKKRTFPFHQAVLSSLPPLLTILEQLPWTSEKKSDWLFKLIETNGGGSGLWRILDSIPEAVQALRSLGWADENIFSRLTHWASRRSDVATLAAIAAQAGSQGWAPEKMEALLAILESFGVSPVVPPRILSVLRALPSLGWNSKAQTDLFDFWLLDSKLLERRLQVADELFNSKRLNRPQKKKFFNAFEQEKLWLLDFSAFETNFGRFGSTDLSENQALELSLNLLKKFYLNAPYAFEQFFEMVPQFSQTGWKPKQKFVIYREWLKKPAWVLRPFDILGYFGRLKRFIRGTLDWPWTPDQSHRIALKILERADILELNGKNIQEVISFLVHRLPDSAFALSDRLFNRLTKNNFSPIMELMEKQIRASEASAAFVAGNFDLLLRFLEAQPRLAYPVLEGIFEARTQGLLPPELHGEAPKLLDFIEKSQSFLPSLYRAYLEEGESLFPRLQDYSREILQEKWGLGEMQEIRDRHGSEFLLALLQRASPATGASFVSRDEQMGVLEQALATGDHRDHLPKAWQGKVETFELAEGSYQPREGSPLEMEEKILALLHLMQSDDPTLGIKEAELRHAFREYLESPRESRDREAFRRIFLSYAAQKPEFQHRLGSLEGGGYPALNLFEILLSDPDNLPRLLNEVWEQSGSTRGNLSVESKPIRGDSRRLLKMLRAFWSRSIDGENWTEERRLEALANILKNYRVEDIETKLLGRTGIPQLEEALRRVPRAALQLTYDRVLAEILGEPLQWIREEKQKYEYQEGGKISLGLRAVKGPAFALHGLTSGVCTATDLELWKNPRFKLLAITDENKNQVLGYIHVFEIDGEGKKYLTLPGINPAVESVERVDAAKLYPNLLDKVVAFAEAGDYHGVYIPVDPNIHSNLNEIRDSIQKAHYPLKSLPPVHWSQNPLHDFSQVYVVWEK